jgi:putative addiction module component (TIGR02574 family)
MGAPAFDFSHLTPEERIQLAADLWDSVTDPAAIPVPAAHADELRRRVERLERDGARGEPWRITLERIEQRLSSRTG